MNKILTYIGRVMYFSGSLLGVVGIIISAIISPEQAMILGGLLIASLGLVAGGLILVTIGLVNNNNSDW